MPIPVRCPACGQGHTAPDRAAGRTLKCLACGESLTVPAPEIDPAAVLLADDDDPPAVTRSTPTHSTPSPPYDPTQEEGYGIAEPDAPPKPSPPPRPRSRGPVKPRPDVSTLPPLTTNDPPFWRRHLHWLLVLAMIPLAVSLLAKRDEGTILDRITDSADKLSPEVQERVYRKLISPEGTLDDVIEIFPNQRLPGAWLSRSTYTHWGLAAFATVLFMVFFMFLASDGSASPLQVLGVGLFTATIGVGFLLLVQAIASLTDGRIVVGGVLMIFFFIFKFIAFSYAAAMDPENGFFLSFLGFTFGVGLCEELVKTIPLLWHRESERGKTWRGLFIWGLASGAGFGIAEGILYSGRYYNGIFGPDIYLVRFISCVALHAIWSGSVAITLYLRRDWFSNLDTWRDWIGPIFAVIAIPMMLHGLYDTCLKRELNGAALLVAVASFGWLAFLSSRLYGTDDAEANRAMLAEYKRRRAVS